MIVEQFNNKKPVPKAPAKVNVTTTRRKRKKKVTIHEVNILDRSGSMSGGKFQNAVEGICEGYQDMLDTQRKEPVKYLQTLTVFNSDVRIPRFMVAVSKQNLTKLRDKCGHTGGLTALYEAIGVTLERLMKEVEEGEAVLVKIFTDGLENASGGKWASNPGRVKKIIEECKDLGWTITFVGTEADVKRAQIMFGIDEGNTLVHDNTPESIRHSFEVNTMATRSYTKNLVSSGGTSTRTSKFYNQD